MANKNKLKILQLIGQVDLTLAKGIDENILELEHLDLWDAQYSDVVVKYILEEMNLNCTNDLRAHGEHSEVVMEMVSARPTVRWRTPTSNGITSGSKR